MSGYVRNIVIKREFEGDNVTIALKPAEFGDMLNFGKIDAKNLNKDELVLMFTKLKAYVAGLSGLKAGDASDVSVDELFSAAYFTGFLTDVLAEWLEKALPANPSSPGASQVESQPG